MFKRTLLVCFLLMFSGFAAAKPTPKKSGGWVLTKQDIERYVNVKNITPYGLSLIDGTQADVAQKAQEFGATKLDVLIGYAKATKYDNDSEGVMNPQLVILEYTGFPGEDIESTRFLFFTNTLYSVRHLIQSTANLEQIQDKLISKYGQPTEGDYLSDVMSWVVGRSRVDLVKTQSDGKSYITITDIYTEARVELVNKALYERFIAERANATTAY